jgi:hypothetical protein
MDDLLMRYDPDQDPYAEKPKKRAQASVYDRLNGTKTGTGRSQRSQKAVSGMEALNLRGGGYRGQTDKKFNERSNADWSAGEPSAARASVETATGKLRLLFDRYGFKGGTDSRSGQAGRRDSYQDGRNLMDEAALIKLMQDCGVLDSSFTESAARMSFQKIKLGRKTEIDFERFQALVREIATSKGVPYDEIVSVAWLQLQVGRKRKVKNSRAIEGKNTNELMQIVFKHYCQFGRSVKQQMDSGDTMDNSQFAKFCYEAPGLICAKFRGHDIDLAFNKAKNKATRRLNFTQFVSACVQIASKHFGTNSVNNDFAQLCSDHIFLLPCIMGTTDADERRRASMAIADHNPIYEDDGEYSSDENEDDAFARQFLASGEGGVATEMAGTIRPKRAPPAPPGKGGNTGMGSTLTNQLTGTQRKMMAPPAGGRPMRQAPRKPGTGGHMPGVQAAEAAAAEQDFYQEEALDYDGMGVGDEHFDGYEDDLYAEEEEEVGQGQAARKPMKKNVSSMLDQFAEEYDSTPLNATYAGSANKKSDVYSRVTQEKTYTGVYKQRMDGRGINMASDHDARRKNEMYEGYQGKTNTASDTTYHSIENMVTRR